MWVIGGFEPRGSEIIGVASARALTLNQSLTAWVGACTAPMRVAPPRRRWRNKIVVVGGGPPAGMSAAEVVPTEVFDGTSWHDAAGISGSGDDLAAASDGTYLYAVGGRRLEVTSRSGGGAAL